MTRIFCAALLVLSGVASAARAADEPPPGGMPAPTESAPPPDSAAPGSGGAGPIVSAGAIGEEAAATRPADLSYGVAARLRWVTVPAWMLNLFTKKNVPLSSWGTGIEFFRRKSNFDLIASLSYQNMSPPDGNWLGKGHNANVDTDYVHFDGLAMWGVDVSFVWHSMFNEWFGMHYGAGIGVGIIPGEILRISNGPQCTEQNAGNINQCYPVGVTPNGSDTLPLPANLTTPRTTVEDSPNNPHQFVDQNKPPVLPIVNILVGFDFRLPQVRGWEAKIEGGFYNAFFLGGGVGYTF
jgi:hypothetical protein